MIKCVTRMRLSRIKNRRDRYRSREWSTQLNHFDFHRIEQTIPSSLLPSIVLRNAMSGRQPSDIFEAVAKDDKASLEYFLNERKVSILSTEHHLGQTVAHIAARYNNLHLLKYLIEKEPSLLKIRDTHGFTVFHRAVDKGSLDMVKYLIDNWESDVYKPVNYIWGNMALHIAAEAGKLDTVKYLVEEKNIDPSMKNLLGQSPAFNAACQKQLEVVKYFVEWQKVDVTVIDVRNDTIISLSTRMKDLSVPRYLLDDRKLKFDINRRGNFGRTIAYWAARIRSTHIMEYYVEEKNADINIPDDMGSTPLHHAAQENNINVIKYLLQHKAVLTARDNEGKTPADLATGRYTKDYLRMKMYSRGRRSVALPIVDQPVPTHYSTNLIEDATFNQKFADQFNSSSLRTLLAVANVFVRDTKRLHRPRTIHRPPLSPQEIAQRRIDPLIIEAINEKSYG